MSASRDDPLENVLERAIEDIDGDKVTLGDVLELFGDRSFGPVITLLGLLTVIPPLGGIPGLPMVVGVVVILFSAQIIFGRKHIWVPGFIRKRSISKDKLKKADEKAKPWLKRIDNLISERLEVLTNSWSVYIAAIVVTFLALMMIPLELVPFVAGTPGAAIAIFGLAFVARDGVLMLIGYALAIVAVLLTVFIVPWGTFLSWFSGGG